MFYSQHVLTKKGPLAKIWLAAHMQSKLTKAMVFATDLRKAVETIISPDAPMALRLTSNLLLGVVRILHRKTKYLLQESSDALTKLKLTFRPASASALVDLPATSSAANFAAVTLADASIDELDAPMVDLSLVPSAPARPSTNSAFLAADRDITIDEFAGGLAGGMLDAFALEPELDRDPRLALSDLDPDEHEPLLFTPSQRPSQQVDRPAPSVRSDPSSVEVTRAAPELEKEGEGSGPVLSIERDLSRNAARDAESLGGLELDDDGGPLPGSPMQLTPPAAAGGAEASPGAPLPSPPGGAEADGDAAVLGEEGRDSGEAAKLAVARISTGSDELALADDVEEDVEEDEGGGDGATDPAVEDDAADKQAEPAPEAAPRGRKRKRFLIDDMPTELTATDFRAFLTDTKDILRDERRTRRRTGHVLNGRRAPLRYEELLARPAITLAPQLNDLFAQSFRMDDVAEQVGSPMSDADLLGPNAQEGGGKSGTGESPAKEKDVETPEKPDAAEDAELSAKDSERIEKAQSEAKSDDGGRTPSKQVVADLFPLSPLPEAEAAVMNDLEGRRSSLGQQENLPLPDDAETREEEMQAFDATKSSLKDVANTRTHVDNGSGGSSDDVDVTESTVSARTRKMQQYITEHLGDDGFLNYSDALLSEPGMNRRTASRSFYELLNLSSKKALQPSQDKAYGTIKARPLQPAFDSLASTGAV